MCRRMPPGTERDTSARIQTCNAPLRASSSGLEHESSGVIDALQEQRAHAAREKLVDRGPRALPVSVVVDDHDPVRAEARIQMLELVPRRLVPVGIEPQERDAFWDFLGNRLFDGSTHEDELVFGITGGAQVCLDVL